MSFWQSKQSRENSAEWKVKVRDDAENYFVWLDFFMIDFPPEFCHLYSTLMADYEHFCKLFHSLCFLFR